MLNDELKGTSRFTFILHPSAFIISLILSILSILVNFFSGGVRRYFSFSSSARNAS